MGAIPKNMPATAGGSWHEPGGRRSGRRLAKVASWDSGRHNVGNLGAFMIRLGFWGPLYHFYNKEPPK